MDSSTPKRLELDNRVPWLFVSSIRPALLSPVGFLQYTVPHFSWEEIGLDQVFNSRERSLQNVPHARENLKSSKQHAANVTCKTNEEVF